MSGAVYKFERDMLQGAAIHVKKKSYTSFKKHWHNYFEIIFYCGCEGFCILNGRRQPVTEDCLFLLTPKDFHEIVTEPRHGSYSIVVSFSEQIVDKKLLHALTAGPVVLYGLSALLRAEVEELLKLFQGEEQYREIQLTHLLNYILIRILKEGRGVSDSAADMNPIIQQSILYMLTNPAEPITLKMIAGKFGITETYFSHLFRDCTGICFKQYLTTLRIECAKRMLEEQQIPVIDVGFECGFNTPSQFVRAFKQAMCMTPSQYRAKARELER